MSNTIPRRTNIGHLALLLVAFTLLIGGAESTVSYNGQDFESMPANFGMSWSHPSRTYPAHLQVLPSSHNNSQLCRDEGLDELVPPNDTLPVVLLVERGNCTFERKARMAMMQHPMVSYMVVYDHTVRNNLVSMKEDASKDGISLGLLFVSNPTGLALKSILQNESQEVLNSGGPVIQLDGLFPDFYTDPSFADLQTWILIAMGGFFTFVTVFGCLLVFVQLGLIPVNGAGQIVLTPEAIRRSRKLMTMDEVKRLQFGGDLYGKMADSEDNTQQSLTSPANSMEEGRGVHSTNANRTANQHGGANDDVVNADTIDHEHAGDEEENTCAVCLDELHVASPVGGLEESTTLCLPCRHKFHVDCIIPWLTERQGTCPLCKFEVLQFVLSHDDREKPVNHSKESFFKRNVSRLMRFGWSPVNAEGSDSDSGASIVNSIVNSEQGSSNDGSGNNRNHSAVGIEANTLDDPTPANEIQMTTITTSI